VGCLRKNFTFFKANEVFRIKGVLNNRIFIYAIMGSFSDLFIDPIFKCSGTLTNI
jgi:hypothetical protein